MTTTATVGWRGILAPLDTPTMDGRTLIAPTTGADISRPMPLPVLSAVDDLLNPSERIGDIHRLWVEDNNLMGEGTIQADDVARARGWFTGGLDLTRDGNVSYRAADGTEVDGNNPMADPVTVVFTGWRIAAFHVHDNPAFKETKLELV